MNIYIWIHIYLYIHIKLATRFKILTYYAEFCIVDFPATQSKLWMYTKYTTGKYLESGIPPRKERWAARPAGFSLQWFGTIPELATVHGPGWDLCWAHSRLLCWTHSALQRYLPHHPGSKKHDTLLDTVSLQKQSHAQSRISCLETEAAVALC